MKYALCGKLCPQNFATVIVHSKIASSGTQLGLCSEYPSERVQKCVDVIDLSHWVYKKYKTQKKVLQYALSVKLC